MGLSALHVIQDTVGERDVEGGIAERQLSSVAGADLRAEAL